MNAREKLEAALAAGRQAGSLLPIAKDWNKRKEIVGIMQNLEAALRAFDRGADDEGRRITPADIGVGLSKMLEDMARHAIWFRLDANLDNDAQACLSSLQQEIEAAARTLVGGDPAGLAASENKRAEIARRLRAVADTSGEIASLFEGIATAVETGRREGGPPSTPEDEVAALAAGAGMLEGMGRKKEAIEVVLLAKAIQDLGPAPTVSPEAPLALAHRHVTIAESQQTPSRQSDNVQAEIVRRLRAMALRCGDDAKDLETVAAAVETHGYDELTVLASIAQIWELKGKASDATELASIAVLGRRKKGRGRWWWVIRRQECSWVGHRRFRIRRMASEVCSRCHGAFCNICMCTFRGVPLCKDCQGQALLDLHKQLVPGLRGQ